MNATFLRQFNYENPPCTQLRRSANVQSMYDQFSKTSGPKAFIEGVKQRIKKEKYILLENMFPYDVEPPIQHKCLWYEDNLSREEVQAIIDQQNMECITFFENPDNLKSIKDVKHYHIFHY